MSDLMASHKVMRHYLHALLTEDVEPKQKVASVEKQQLSALLATVTTEPVIKVNKPPVQTSALITKHSPVSSGPARTVLSSAPSVEPAQQSTLVTNAVTKTQTLDLNSGKTDLNLDVTLSINSRESAPAPNSAAPAKEYRQGKFQALFFEVAGLKVALPLKELGGIHKMLPLNTLPSKPQWYRGVMLYREQKINVVDTARWVMPEKYDEKLEETLNYQYVIMLGKSSWGLACETLVNTVTLDQDDVKWRSTEGKRPWLAGLIKQHMCALLDVDAMVALLAQGAGSSD
jgi:purine-binding chemotaxis protein CheW